MTNAELIQAIKAEIEKRILEKDHGFEDGEAEYGYNTCLKDMRRFLSALETEKPMNQDEELTEEIKRFIRTFCVDKFPTVNTIARHFAQWQYQKDREEFAQIKAKTWCEGFDACKEQMLKEAVEGEVIKDNRGNNVVRAGVFNKDFEYMDKVRIIIVKEDEK